MLRYLLWMLMLFGSSCSSASGGSRIACLVDGQSKQSVIEVLQEGASAMRWDEISNLTPASLRGHGLSVEQSDAVARKCIGLGASSLLWIRRHYGALSLGRDSIAVFLDERDIIMGVLWWRDD